MIVDKILKNSKNRMATGKMGSDGLVEVSMGDIGCFSAGQKVRVLEQTGIHVMNSLTGECMGDRKRCIGRGVVRQEGNRMIVMMNTKESELIKGTRQLKGVTTSKYKRINAVTRRKKNLPVFIQEELE